MSSWAETSPIDAARCPELIPQVARLWAGPPECEKAAQQRNWYFLYIIYIIKSARASRARFFWPKWRFLDDLGVIWGARDAARQPGFWPWKIFDRNKMQSKKWHGIWDQIWPKFGSRSEIFLDRLATDFQSPEEKFWVNRMAFLILPAAFWNSSGHDFVKSRNTFC